MSLTLDDCRRLGIPLELHPAYSGRSDASILRERFGVEAMPGQEPQRLGGLPLDRPKRSKPEDGMNKTERSFRDTLEGAKSRQLITWYGRESITFRLAGRTRYTPDFLVCGDFGQVCVEVKGYMRDDAAVKLKVAAEMYQHFGWLLVRRDGRHGWDVRKVTSRGIGTEPIRVAWIHGA